MERYITYPDNYIKRAPLPVPNNAAIRMYLTQHRYKAFQPEISSDHFETDTSQRSHGPTDNVLNKYADIFDEASKEDPTIGEMLRGNPPNFQDITPYSMLTTGDDKVICIGEGTYGTNILAQHKESGQLVVFKLQRSCHPIAIIKEYVMQRRAREILNTRVPQVLGFMWLKETSMTRHPNCFSRLVIVSEFCSMIPNIPVAIPLSKAYRLHGSGQSMLTEEQWRKLMLSIMDSAKKLQENNLYHLDITPDNILLHFNPNGTVDPVIIDFGISVTSAGTAYHPTFMGNPQSFPHVDPHLFSASNPLPTTDVYSVMYTLGLMSHDLDLNGLKKVAYYYCHINPTERWVFASIRDLVSRATVGEDIEMDIRRLEKGLPPGADVPAEGEASIHDIPEKGIISTQERSHSEIESKESHSEQFILEKIHNAKSTPENHSEMVAPKRRQSSADNVSTLLSEETEFLTYSPHDREISEVPPQYRKPHFTDFLSPDTQYGNADDSEVHEMYRQPHFTDFLSPDNDYGNSDDSEGREMSPQYRKPHFTDFLSPDTQYGNADDSKGREMSPHYRKPHFTDFLSPDHEYDYSVEANNQCSKEEQQDDQSNVIQKSPSLSKGPMHLLCIDGSHSETDAIPSIEEESRTNERTRLSKHQKSILQAWHNEHAHLPYINDGEVGKIAKKLGITVKPVRAWLRNTRK